MTTQQQVFVVVAVDSTGGRGDGGPVVLGVFEREQAAVAFAAAAAEGWCDEAGVPRDELDASEDGREVSVSGGEFVVSVTGTKVQS